MAFQTSGSDWASRLGANICVLGEEKRFYQPWAGQPREGTRPAACRRPATAKSCVPCIHRTSMAVRPRRNAMRMLARLLLLLVLAASSAALAQGYPNRTVKVVVPWPPGQATDIVARIVAERLAS